MNLVFDFGAVLFTWQPQLFLRSYFPDLVSTPERAAALAKDFFHHADWQAFDQGKLSMEVVIDRTADRLALPADRVQALIFNIGELLTPMRDSVEVLAHWHARRESEGDVRLYFLSNMPTPYARLLEQRHDFLQWFDGGIFSGDVQHIKPAPGIYELLERRYALDPGNTLFIDDLLVNVEAAQARGWHGIHFESAPQLQARLTQVTGLMR